MSNDEHACILKLCHQNLETNVRKCVMQTFNGYIDAYTDQLNDLKKPERVKKTMKRFQTKLKFLAMDDDCEDLHEDFFALLCTEIDYLETILMQITKLKLQLLSKVRTSKVSDLDMKLPDKSEFAREILQKNSYTFFHLVPTYYQYYQTRNVLQIKPIIDSVTQEVMDSLTTRTYSLFFSRPPEPHVVYQNKMDDILKKSGCENPQRPIPKEVEDAFHEEKGEKGEKEEKKPPPEYKTLFIDEEDKEHERPREDKEHERPREEKEPSEKGEEKPEPPKAAKNVQLQKLLQDLKNDNDKDSNASDELDDALPRDPLKDND